MKSKLDSGTSVWLEYGQRERELTNYIAGESPSDRVITCVSSPPRVYLTVIEHLRQFQNLESMKRTQ